MGGIFISYRRGDTEGQARALSIELANYVGEGSVFMDVDSIALGRDFRQSLHESLGSCDALLALVGPNWLDSEDAAGRRRLDDPADFVRQEIATALKRNIPVTPVLLQGRRCRRWSACPTISRFGVPERFRTEPQTMAFGRPGNWCSGWGSRALQPLARRRRRCESDLRRSGNRVPADPSTSGRSACATKACAPCVGRLRAGRLRACRSGRRSGNRPSPRGRMRSKPRRETCSVRTKSAAIFQNPS